MIADPLGLAPAYAQRLLPVTVAAMAFLGCLALGASLSAHALAQRWQLGAATAVTATIPEPGRDERMAQALAVLRGSPAVRDVRALAAAETEALLRPWLGTAQVPQDLLPGVIALRRGEAASEADLAGLADRLTLAVPGATLERHAAWLGRLVLLLRAIEAGGWVGLGFVSLVAILMVTVVTRAGLVAGRATLDTLHGLGATDGHVAGRFARRAGLLATVGGFGGAALAMPVLLTLARLAQPLDPEAAASPLGGLLRSLPWPLLAALPSIPVAAGILGWGTAQATVRLWLRRVP